MIDLIAAAFRFHVITLLMVLVATSTSAAGVRLECGSLDNGYGPYDYSNPSHFAEKLPVVEKWHFTPEVENLNGHKKCGGDQCQLAADLDYTLRAFPNHHRALMAMANYHIRGMSIERPMRYSAECYFERALRFKPGDGNVHVVYGYFLHRLGNVDQAVMQFEKAVELMPHSAEAHYNLGLAYFTVKKYDRAREQARKAYELGFPLPGLRRKLQREGKWE